MKMITEEREHTPGASPTEDDEDGPVQYLKNPHPGETILEDFLQPWRMTPYRLAKAIGVPYTRVAEILKGRRAITADTALRLSRFLGCSPEFWLRLQMSYDLLEVRRRA